MIQTGKREAAGAVHADSTCDEGSALKKLVIFAVGSYTLLMAASLVFAQVSAGKLAAERCSSCHDTARICEKLGNRSLDVWQQTVDRMSQSAALATVAPGISEALVTTAIGLVVAIPATIAYNYLLAMLGEVETELVNFAGAFLNRIEREVSWAAGSSRHQ